MFTTGDKTEQAGLSFIQSLSQEMKFLQQQFQQIQQLWPGQSLHLSERVAAIEADLTIQRRRICNVEERITSSIPVKAPPHCLGQSAAPSPAETVNAEVRCNPLAVKALPSCPGQFTTTPSPAENVKVDDAKPLTAKAPPPRLQIASPMPAETVNVKVDDAKPIPVKTHPPPLPLKAPPPVTVKVFAGTGPLTAVQVIEHAKQLPVKAPPEFPMKYPPPHPPTAGQEASPIWE